MKKTIKLFVTVALGATLVAGALAQSAGPAGGGVQSGGQGGQLGGKAGKAGRAGGMKAMQKMEEEIWAKLTPPLTADQKTKLEVINQKAKDGYKALMTKAKASGGDRSALKDDFLKIQSERKDSIKALLTADQYKSYDAALKAAREKAMKEGKGKKAGGKGVG